MQRFWSRLGGEFLARRQRLRDAIDDRNASLLEFAALAGLLLGPLSIAVTPGGVQTVPWAVLLPAALTLGYLSIEARRQKAETAGAPDTQRFDRWTLWLAVAGFLAGAATFIFALTAPEPYRYAPPDPPARSFSVDIEG
jgi:hypothetical protein